MVGEFSQVMVRRQWKIPGTPPADSSCAAKSSWVWGLEKWGMGEVGKGEKEKPPLINSLLSTWSLDYCDVLLLKMVAFQELDLLY